MYRIPHNVCEETHGIIVKLSRMFDRHIPGLRAVTPIGRRHYFSRSPVNDFPPSFYVVPVIHFQHVRIQMIHQVNGKLLLHRCAERCHNIHLLDFIRIGIGPLVILPGRVVSGVDLGVHMF